MIDRIYRTKKEIESIKKGAFAAAASSSAKKLSNAPTHTILTAIFVMKMR